MSDLLSRLNRDGGGFLFRHGWVVELLVGLLKIDPDQRISITAAREVMSSALVAARGPSRAGGDAYKNTGFRGRASKQREVRASVSPPGAGLGMMETLSASQREQLRAAFDKFDVDGSGDIDSEEIVGAMSNIGVKVSRGQGARAVNDSIDVEMEVMLLLFD